MQAWEIFSSRRCAGKTRFPNMARAERRAEALSIRTGDLILAYECADCGRFHVGHADLSQRLARAIHVDRNCLRCGKPIYETLQQKAKRWGSPSLYCSAGCRKAARKESRTQEKETL